MIDRTSSRQSAIACEMLENRTLLSISKLEFVSTYEPVKPEFTDVQADRDGNFYLAGSFSGRIDLDRTRRGALWIESASLGSFVAKYRADGVPIWARQFSCGSMPKLTVDPDGKVILAGGFSGTVDFDPSPAVHNLIGGGDEDGFVVKLDANGNFLFANRIRAGKGRIIQIASLTTDSDGAIIVGGQAIEPWAGWVMQPIVLDNGTVISSPARPPTDRAFIIKYKAAGKSQWIHQWGGQVGHSVKVDALTTDAQNDVFFATNQIGSIDYNPADSEPAVAGDNTVLGKLTTSGQPLFARPFASSRDNSVHVLSMKTDSTGQLYLGGALYGTADFNLSASRRLPLTSLGDGDGFVARYSPDADLVWVNRLGGASPDFVRSLAIDARDRIYVAGRFYSAIDFNPSRRQYILDSEQGESYIAVFAPSGNPYSVTQFGDGEGGTAIQTMALTPTAIVLTGSLHGSQDIDPTASTFLVKTDYRFSTLNYLMKLTRR